MMSSFTRGLAAAMLVCAGAGAAGAQAIDPTVFVTNNVSDQISVFRVQEDGSLLWQANYATGDGPQAMALSPNGRYLAVGHGTSNQVTEEMRFFEVNSDGSLTPLFTGFVPDSPLDVVWIDDDTIAVTDTEIGGTNVVQTYDVDLNTNQIIFIDDGFTGSFSTDLELNPTRTRLYANDSFGDRIYAFDVAPNGALTELLTIGTAPNFAVSLTISHDDTRLYGGGGISGDGNRVLGYEVQGDGNLVPLPGSPFFSPGESPKNAAFTEDDSMLFVGHGTDATLRAFFVEPDGTLTYTGYFFDVGLQGTLDSVAIKGDLLFVTDESTAIDGVYGVYSFRIDQKNGTLEEIGLFETFGTRPEKIVPWPGVQTDGERAELTDLTITFGSLLSGSLDDLRESDDARVRTRSGIGFSALEPSLMRLLVGATTGFGLPNEVDITIESRLNNPNGTATIFLRNFAENELEQVGQYTLSTTETVETISDVSLDNRLRLDGRIELGVKHVVVAIFSVLGFDSFIDQVDLFVHDS